GAPPPRLLRYSFDLAIDTVLFYAEAPGRYTLSYGGVPAAAPDAGRQEARSAPAGVDAAWVPPGPEEEARQPALPAAAAPGAMLSARHFRVSWPVTADDQAAGDLGHPAPPERD